MDVSACPAWGKASPEDTVIHLAAERVPPLYGASYVRRPTVDLRGLVPVFVLSGHSVLTLVAENREGLSVGMKGY